MISMARESRYIESGKTVYVNGSIDGGGYNIRNKITK